MSEMQALGKVVIIQYYIDNHSHCPLSGGWLCEQFWVERGMSAKLMEKGSPRNQKLQCFFSTILKRDREQNGYTHKRGALLWVCSHFWSLTKDIVAICLLRLAIFFCCVCQSPDRNGIARLNPDDPKTLYFHKGMSSKNVKESQEVEQVAKIGSEIIITFRHEAWRRKRLK